MLASVVGGCWLRSPQPLPALPILPQPRRILRPPRLRGGCISRGAARASPGRKEAGKVPAVTQAGPCLATLMFGGRC